MTPVDVALLFVGNPSLALEHFTESLTDRLAQQDIAVEEVSPESGALVSFRAAGALVSVMARSAPLAADSFRGALDSPLSKPVIGLLAETLARHSRHIKVSVSMPDRGHAKGTTLLKRLKIAHATTVLLAEWHMPAAVHWIQSNQLLTGSQYLQLSTDPTPWALFAQARVTYGGEQDQMVRPRGVQLDDAIDFIGRPIRFVETQVPLDEIHAAALSFLRHTVQTGEPIPDGNTFGPKDGRVFHVKHIEPCDDMPDGVYELSVVSTDADKTLGDPARSSKVIQIGRDLPLSANLSMAGVAAPHPRERTRSMAISYLMLVIMPPVGAILLMSNAIFGSNVWRTGVVAVASVAVAVLVGTYTFMNSTKETALLFETDLIKSTVLAD
ncbi:MAG: hypothetical protein ACU0C9_07550 [Paracoccaceae bacterium]